MFKIVFLVRFNTFDFVRLVRVLDNSCQEKISPGNDLEQCAAVPYVELSTSGISCCGMA